jgi:drug/metabolite transporter (DMT)-like permease
VTPGAASDRPPNDARAGLALAAGTALVSGVAVFVNSYGVHAIPSPAVYTTAKNLVAFVLLAVVALAGRRVPGLDRFGRRTPAGASALPSSPLAWLGLAYVGVVGGGVAFVLFFEGLARTSATPAAFWHDTAVVWVAALAMPLLGERLRWWNAGAVMLLVAGPVVLAHGVGRLALDRGQLLVLGATVLWSFEVVVVRWLLRGLSAAQVSLVRMGIGGMALLVYLGATGSMHLLASFGTRQVFWALLTGCLLAAYVGMWMSALARAHALDVASVLVASVFVTALLQDAAGTARLSGQFVGIVLIVMSVALVLVLGSRATASAPASKGSR